MTVSPGAWAIRLDRYSGGWRASGDLNVVIGRSVFADGEEKGLCASWSWDGHELVVRDDPFGFASLFCHISADTIVIGSSPFAMVALGLAVRLDTEALALFARLGFHVFNRTLYREITRFPRGAVLRVGPAGVQFKTHELPFPSAAARNIPEASDAWESHFAMAVRRRLPSSDFVLPLSGGRDSRMLLLELIRHGFSPAQLLTITGSGVPDNADAVAAAALTAALGQQLQCHRQSRKWYVNEMQRNVQGGCNALEHNWIIDFLHAVDGSRLLNYDGLGAGVITRGDLCSPQCLQATRSGDAAAVAHILLSKALHLPDHGIRLLQREGIIEELKDDDLIDRITSAMKPYETYPNPLTAFTFFEWNGRAIALNAHAFRRGGSDVQTPFMDKDLLLHALSIPLSMAIDDDIQTGVCLRRYPEVAGVAFAGKEVKKVRGARRPIRTVVEATLDRAAMTLNLANGRWPIRDAIRATTRRDMGALSALALRDTVLTGSTPNGARKLLDRWACDDQG